MNYKHFTLEERCCLREYYIKGKSYREIAKLLGRNVSSISRELRRNCTFYRDVPRYYPYTAQRKSNLRNSYGLLREFYPKGKNPEIVSEKTLKKSLALINARPKKVLNFQKPVDLFEENLAKCCT